MIEANPVEHLIGLRRGSLVATALGRRPQSDSAFPGCLPGTSAHDHDLLCQWVQQQWLLRPSDRARQLASLLDNEQRLLVGLALFAGLKSSAIASVSGLSRIEVRTGLHRALSLCGADLHGLERR